MPYWKPFVWNIQQDAQWVYTAHLTCNIQESRQGSAVAQWKSAWLESLGKVSFVYYLFNLEAVPHC